MNILKKIGVWTATGFGLGYSPVSSGTVGTLWALPLTWLILTRLTLPWQLVTMSVMTLLSVLVCEVAERHLGKKDDGRIVADEYLTFPICMIGIAPTPAHFAMAFVVSRILDIIKPPPARKLQDLHGGVGITIDDLIANVYALAVNHSLLYAWQIIHG